MAESADAPDSGSGRGNSVEVQVLLSAPKSDASQGDVSLFNIRLEFISMIRPLKILL